VLASWYEVVPLVSLEAMAAGCPVVQGTRSYAKEYLCPSTTTYWDLQTGIEGLADAIRQSLTKSQNSTRTGKYRKMLEWSRVGDRLMAAYASV
jgi:glycosyltransferase involved in cell wall biosynthesis